MSTDSQRSPEYWRGRAAEARAMLEKARDPKVRSYLTEIAQEYERLATIAGQHWRTHNNLPDDNLPDDPPKRCSR